MFIDRDRKITLRSKVNALDIIHEKKLSIPYLCKYLNNKYTF